MQEVQPKCTKKDHRKNLMTPVLLKKKLIVEDGLNIRSTKSSSGSRAYEYWHLLKQHVQ